MEDNKQKIGEKGYTIEVTSWENDGDHYATNTLTLEDKEVSKQIGKYLFEVIAPISNDHGHLKKEKILEFLDNNLELKNFLKNRWGKEIDEEEEILEELDEVITDLLGSSEYYNYRVPESISITYLPEDIFAEYINF